MAMKSEPAAIERAIKTFRTLETEDQDDVYDRLVRQQAKPGLAGMAYVAEIAGDLSPDGRTYLVAQLAKIVEADAASVVPTPAPVSAASATTKKGS